MARTLSGLFLAAILFTGCVTLEDPLKKPREGLPSAYAGITDSANVATMDWRVYFGDTLLVQLLDSAMANNLDLRMALQRVEVARASTRAAKGAQLPMVGVNAASAQRRYGLYTMDGAGNISTEILPGQIVPIDLPDYYLALQASWEVDIWGRLRNQRKAALARYMASQEAQHLAMTNLVADVAVAYYELVALDNELQIIRETVNKQREALDVIQQQKEAGRANELAVQQFEAQLLGTLAFEKELQQRVLETENLINFLLGRYPRPIARDIDALRAPSSADPAIGLPTQLLSNRPDVRASEYALLATRFDLKAARAAFHPNLNLVAGFGYQAFRTDLLFESPSSIAYQVVGSLSAPLLNRSALKAQFNAASAQQLEAMYTYQQHILRGYLEVVNELNDLRNLGEAVDLKRQQSETLQRSVGTSRELYRSAKANYMEVLLAQQNALQANIELVELSKRQRFAAVDLYKALGGGWR